MKDHEIYAVLAAKRFVHPELHRPLTWKGLQRICAREDVGIYVRPHAEAAQLVVYDGGWGIIVDSRLPARRHTAWAAHELAHLWLHVDRADGRHAAVFNLSGYEGPDPREDDADFLATLLLGGPSFMRHLR